ncbi:hypothetical protein DFQ27_003444 [Actinomortierella ambigua]|uniref:Ribosome maturation protein SDO1/SBDS N-terminal domain-containing protein n=1 Tax=Actinomortierella ambigua TaxID=1343610 RepID=A0A9P6Q842_9FUNG|nr:hypothetical protein DFQ26_005032 [Actinomortierella ambigua]KAG0260596.1 hypothetical protein DFQ27_003444 [Actinomortierella ambigua]
MEKIIYKTKDIDVNLPDLFVLAEPGMTAKYREQRRHQGAHRKHPSKDSDLNEPALALVDVVQSYAVFQTETGKGFSGNIDRPSKASLYSIFGTENEEEVVERIILDGEIQRTHA